jgi:FixJ family two-component response regulator
VKQWANELSATVIVVDDDASVRSSLGTLVRSVGFRFVPFSSALDFSKAELPDGPTCLILDIRMPGQSGLELQQQLCTRAQRRVPIIFITAHGDIPMSVRAMKAGAIEFFTKPFRDQDLLDAIEAGHARDRLWLEHERASSELRIRYKRLTRREREVMKHVVSGRLNKQIAAELGITEITVKVHRGQVMRKMCASSLPDLTRMSDCLQIVPPRPMRLSELHNSSS